MSLASTTSIEWTDRSWNPTTGCTKVSAGCDHCYAEKIAERFRGVPGHAYEHGFDLTLHPERLEKLARLKKPQRIFVNSMSDLFHSDIPDEFIFKVYWAMVAAEQHDFQVLTKRPERMRRVIPRAMKACASLDCDSLNSPAPNVWLGVSVESNDVAWRVKHLRETPAAIRFLSVEPMLGPIDMVSLVGVDWVIVGGESGSSWRPMQLEWARDVRDRCRDAEIPFFMKQVAGYRPNDEQIPEDLRIREFPVGVNP